MLRGYSWWFWGDGAFVVKIILNTLAFVRFYIFSFFWQLSQRFPKYYYYFIRLQFNFRLFLLWIFNFFILYSLRRGTTCFNLCVKNTNTNKSSPSQREEMDFVSNLFWLCCCCRWTAFIWIECGLCWSASVRTPWGRVAESERARNCLFLSVTGVHKIHNIQQLNKNVTNNLTVLPVWCVANF